MTRGTRRPRPRVTGDYVQQLLNQRGMSATALCRETGIPSGSLSAMRQGDAPMTWRTCQRIARALAGDPDHVPQVAVWLAAEYGTIPDPVLDYLMSEPEEVARIMRELGEI